MKITLRPMAPYDFELSAGIFNNGEPRRGRFENGRLRQPIRLGDRLALATARGGGTTDEPRLTVELESNDSIGRSDAARAREVMKCMLNLDLDLVRFRRAVSGDPVMSNLAVRLKGLKPPSTQSAFETLVYSIIEQQISLVAAISMQDRLVLSVGDPLKTGGNIYRAFPTPKKLAALSLERYREFGLSGRKSEYIRDTARMLAEGKVDFEALKKEPDPEVVRQKLVEIRGIGEWTAEMTMIRGMQRFDMVPADDVGLQMHFGKWYASGGKASPAELREIASQWHPFGGLGCYYLVVAERLGLKTPGSGRGASRSPHSKS